MEIQRQSIKFYLESCYPLPDASDLRRPAGRYPHGNPFRILNGIPPGFFQLGSAMNMVGFLKWSTVVFRNIWTILKLPNASNLVLNALNIDFLDTHPISWKDQCNLLTMIKYSWISYASNSVLLNSFIDACL